MSERLFRWLHLSDLHLGQPQGERWNTVRRVVVNDIAKVTAQIGKPDVIFFTGDIAFSGKTDDYLTCDQVLTEIRNATGANPLVIPVPGNHDLIRPSGGPLHLLVSSYFDEQKRSRWNAGDYQRWASEFDATFAGYKQWFTASILKEWDERGLSYLPGRLPGEFVLTTVHNTMRIGVLGLNSTFLHIGDQEEGSLAVEDWQARFILPDIETWASHHDACFLLMHHPPEWLHPVCQKALLETFYPPQRFVACLFGHRHEGLARTDNDRLLVQAASLFGLEWWGTKKESRSYGYAWGELRLGAASSASRLIVRHRPIETNETQSLAVVETPPHEIPVQLAIVKREGLRIGIATQNTLRMPANAALHAIRVIGVDSVSLSVSALQTDVDLLIAVVDENCELSGDELAGLPTRVTTLVVAPRNVGREASPERLNQLCKRAKEVREYDHVDESATICRQFVLDALRKRSISSVALQLATVETPSLDGNHVDAILEDALRLFRENRFVESRARYREAEQLLNTMIGEAQ